jgi:hypothetical protein
VTVDRIGWLRPGNNRALSPRLGHMVDVTDTGVELVTLSLSGMQKTPFVS